MSDVFGDVRVDCVWVCGVWFCFGFDLVWFGLVVVWLFVDFFCFKL